MATGGTLGIFLAMLIGGWIAEYYGWRVAFLVAGLPGIILAILVRATIKEPLRGQYDTAEPGNNTPSAWSTLRFLFGLRSYRHMVIAGSLQSFAGIGAAVWSTAFLMRIHDMSIGVAGTTLAFLDTAFAALGILLWGVVADRLGRRDSRWYQWIPALGTILSLPFYLLFLMLPNADSAIVFLAPSALFFAAWIAPSHALAQSLAKPQMRAMSSAAMLLFQSLIGMGLGPLAVGLLNDTLSSRFGDAAIRYSLVIITLVSIWGAMHNLIATRTLHQDLNAQTP
jgi:MFS family permease